MTLYFVMANSYNSGWGYLNIDGDLFILANQATYFGMKRDAEKFAKSQSKYWKDIKVESITVEEV